MVHRSGIETELLLRYFIISEALLRWISTKNIYLRLYSRKGFDQCVFGLDLGLDPKKPSQIRYFPIERAFGVAGVDSIFSKAITINCSNGTGFCLRWISAPAQTLEVKNRIRALQQNELRLPS